MSSHWAYDIHKMHDHYGITDAMRKLSTDRMIDLLDFRIRFLQEELNELIENKTNAEETVDALIDICVVALGTLDLYGVDAGVAWNEVLRANMQKVIGIKPSRPNPIIPHLVKPEGWMAPSHEGNHGKFKRIEDYYK